MYENNTIIWLPTSIDKIIDSFCFDSKMVLKKNLAYNIQYLQFISKNIEEQQTTSVINKMRYKSFIISSMSIIESIFIALLDERNLIPLDEWKETEHKHKEIDDNTVEVRYLKKRSSPKKKKISFDEAIHLVEKNNVLTLNNNMYPVIRFLQELRNKIHLEKAKDINNSDYNSFDNAAYYLTKEVLYNVLNNRVVSKNNEYIEMFKNKPQ